MLLFISQRAPNICTTEANRRLGYAKFATWRVEKYSDIDNPETFLK